jgi:hypothetical protein
MAVAGLDVLRRGIPAPRLWYAIPAALLLVAAAWCASAAVKPPEPYARKMEDTARRSRRPEWAMSIVRRAQHTFLVDQLVGAGWAAAGVLLWVGLTWRRHSHWLIPLAGAAWTAELLVFAWDRNAQCDPALYYPPVPALEKLATRPPGRVIGLRCLRPMLSVTCGLRDVRGYDGVDPLRLVQLLNSVKDPRYSTTVYADLQDYVPLLPLGPEGKGVRLPPVLSMLNLRYVVGRGPAPQQITPLLQEDDYWVWENKEVLPRAYVPAAVRPAPSTEELVRLLGAPQFNPRAVAYTDKPPNLPGPARGTAEILDEVPTRLTLRADMETPGLVVLSDLWYEGWEATVDGRAAPVLRVNHALRGVVVPAGTVFIEFTYRPKGFYLGLRLLVAALAAGALWAAALDARRLRRRRKATPAPAPAPEPVKGAAAGPPERKYPRGKAARRRRGFPG